MQSVPSHRTKASQKFSWRQYAPIHQLPRMDGAFAGLESTKLLSLGYLAGSHEPFANVFQMLLETNGMMSMIRQSEKPYCSGKGV